MAQCKSRFWRVESNTHRRLTEGVLISPRPSQMKGNAMMLWAST